MLNKTLMLDRFVFSFPLLINNCFTEDFPVARYAQPGLGGGGRVFNNLRGSCGRFVLESRVVSRW